MKPFLNNCIKFAREKGWIATLTSRRRQLPDINKTDYIKRSYAERQSVNAVIQGSASDMMKLAMLRIQSRICQRQDRVRIVLQLHDEIVLEVPKVCICVL